jgi:hypothetical protein
MAKKNRNTLKNYFKSGRLPSQKHFIDLIDSALNVIDEGFDRSAADGFKVSQLGNEGKLISFFKNIDVKSPLWSLKVDWQSGNLLLGNQDSESILTLSPSRRVGINRENPAYELDVNGIVASDGRIGRRGAKTAHANGQWQDLTEPLQGCHAYEIMAGVGQTGTGKYALLHAFALKTFDARGKIKYNQAHYGSRCHRLKLRWQAVKDKETNQAAGDKQYKLQIKTGNCYGNVSKKACRNADADVGIYIRYYLTTLWFDHGMIDCQSPGKTPSIGGVQGGL